MVKRTELVIENVENNFLGITVPNFSLFKVQLKQKIQIIKKIKNGEEESRVNDYVLSIDRSNISKGDHNELAKELQKLFGMSWTPFNWTTQTFNYFTTKYTGDDEFKKQQLINIFNYLSNFENTYKDKKELNLNEFNEDKVVFETYKDEELIVKYHKETDAMVILAVGYLDSDKYKLLALASKETKKLGESSLYNNLFDDLYQSKAKDKKTYFVVNAYDYKNVKNLIEKKKEIHNQFMEDQSKVIAMHKEDFLYYNEKNIFDFKLIFNEDKKCFEFFCKGYMEPSVSMYGDSAERTVLARWALNFILSEEIMIEMKEGEEFDPALSNIDIELDNHYKTILSLRQDSSKRDHMLWVPAQEWEKLNKIYKKFQKENEIFGREEKSIKILNIDVINRSIEGVNMDRYPAIYLDNKGKATLVYQYRSLSERVRLEEDGFTIKKRTPASITMKGVPISFEEMNAYCETHPFAEHIKNNTVFLNTEIWMRADNQNMMLTPEERTNAFESIYIHAKLANETKEMPKAKKKKI